MRTNLPVHDAPVPESGSPVDRLLGIAKELQSTLRWLAREGVRGFGCSPDTLHRLRQWDFPPTGAGVLTLETIRRDLGECTRCRLSQTRNKIVFGAGSPRAALMFVGEAPGHEEDLQGLPFVGAAGQLLEKIIGVMGLTRDTVYIGNIVKCRPPGNRNPQPDEIRQCLPFLVQQIQAVNPGFICALGTVAAQTLLETRRPISLLRGKFHDFRGIRLLPIYHPAYLLRNPEKKRETWEDIKLLMREMNLKSKHFQG